jgi:hypothetical protein
MTAVHPDASQQAVVEAALVLLERMGLTPADQRVPGGGHLTVADLDRERIHRKPVLGGLISEYTRAA